MRRLFVFVVCVATVLLVEAALVRHPRATSVVQSGLQPQTVKVSPLQGLGLTGG